MWRNVSSAGSMKRHGPPPNKYNEITEDCNTCTPLTPEQKEIFKECWELIDEAHRKSEGSNEYQEVLLRLGSLLQEHKEILNLHNPSKEFGCETLLHHASDFSDYGTMEILLNAGANPNVINRWSQLPLHEVVDEGDGCHCSDCNEKNAKCVELLLERESVVDWQDWLKDTPLSCAALTKMDDCARVLWEAGASINFQGEMNGTRSNTSSRKTGELLASHIPDEVSNWMDAAIRQDDEERLRLHLDFGPVMGAVPGEEGERETRFLRYIAKAHRKARETLLLHPLTQAYIHVKWDAVSILFNLLTIVYLGMAAIYTLFIIYYFLYLCPHEEEDMDNNLGSKDILNARNSSKQSDNLDGNEEQESCKPDGWIHASAIILGVQVVCMMLNELYEVAQGLGTYLQNGLNFGWLVLIATMSVNIVSAYTGENADWEYVVAGFGLFLQWSMLMSLLARDSRTGIYVEMLGRVVREFCRFAFTYFVLILGFALGFAVIFPHHPMYEHTYGLLPIVKVLLMMNGELDYETLLDEEENPRVSKLEYSIGANIIFVGFMIVVPILLMNLLLGLVITDVQELKAQALLSQTERRILQIDLLETFAQKPWLLDCIRSAYKSSFSIEAQCRKLNEELDPYSYGYDDSGDEEEKDADGGQVNHGFIERAIDVEALEPARDNNNFIRYVKRIGPVLRKYDPLGLKENDAVGFPEWLKEQLVQKYVDTNSCSKKRE